MKYLLYLPSLTLTEETHYFSSGSMFCFQVLLWFFQGGRSLSIMQNLRWLNAVPPLLSKPLVFFRRARYISSILHGNVSFVLWEHFWSFYFVSSVLHHMRMFFPASHWGRRLGAGLKAVPPQITRAWVNSCGYRYGSYGEVLHMFAINGKVHKKDRV
ncbi:hypothetical protein FOCC_FOCC006398 [Frankliniella occidentalis]|nr:hypothetical protein FOCC_FOCC006398 [Frankliniella occidentalis]